MIAKIEGGHMRRCQTLADAHIISSLLCLVVGVGIPGRAAASEKIPSAIAPPEQPVTITVESKLKVSDDRTNTTATTASTMTNTLTFSRNDSGLWVSVHTVSAETRSGEGAFVPDPLFSVPGGLTVRIQLSPEGQAQQVTGLESALKQLNAQRSGQAAQLDAATVAQVVLRAWNSSYGTVWAMALGQEVGHAAKTFSGHLQLGLLTGAVNAGVDDTPLKGTLRLQEQTDVPDSPWELSYEYDGELKLDGPTSDGFNGALRIVFSPTPAVGRWTMSRVTGKGQASLDRTTLLIRHSTLQQQLTVTDESHATLTLERQVTLSMATTATNP